MKIAKDFRWEMGHRLQCHKGKCYNLHGHSYSLNVEFEGSITKSGNMVIDYFDVKDLIAPLVDELDHTIIVWEEDTLLLEAMKNLNTNIVVVDFETTAENLCGYFLSKIKEVKLPPNISGVKIRVCETENTYAEESIKI